MNARPSRTVAAGLAAALLILPAIGAAAEQAPSGQAILQKVDQAMNAPRDQDVQVRLVLVDKNGSRTERILRMYQKGADTRMTRFLSPASWKGISALSLPDGSIYLYLPAFGTVSRITSSAKNTTFAGTDFTYEDMEARRYAEAYDAELIRTEAECWVLQLKPRPGTGGAAALILMWVRQDTCVPITLEYYNAKRILVRRLTCGRIEQIGGYWVAREREMTDIAKNHRSLMIIDAAVFDSGLSDEIFTTDYLRQ
jgi:outer membrane lipoprotein-sorting protein